MVTVNYGAMRTRVYNLETYCTKADVIATRIRQVEVNVCVQRVDGEAHAAEFEGDIDLLVAWELPDLATEFRTAYELRARNVLVESLRY